MANGDSDEPRETIRSRLLEVFSDGQPHPYRELFACFDDELADSRNLSSHICALRDQLHPLGQEIVCVVFNRRYYYQQVRFLLDGPTPNVTIRGRNQFTRK